MRIVAGTVYLDAVYAATGVSGEVPNRRSRTHHRRVRPGQDSVAEELAAVLEEHNAPYALLELDFLAWFDTGGEGGPTEHRMMLRNLAALVGNYLGVGVRFFVLAKALRDRAQLEDLRAGLPMPLKVVRLTVPLEEIEERLSHDPTTGRRDDLREAAVWVAASFGVGIEDLTVPNGSPIRKVAVEVLGWLGWPERGSPRHASSPEGRGGSRSEVCSSRFSKQFRKGSSPKFGCKIVNRTPSESREGGVRGHSRGV